MIGITTYMKNLNRLPIIKKSFDSLIKTIEPEQIIVVDDWSPLREHIEYIKSLWIKVIEKEDNRWYSKAKNTLIKYILDKWEDYWFLADDDNLYEEWREEQYIEAMNKTWYDHWCLRLSYLTLDHSQQPYWIKKDKNWYTYRQTPLVNWCFYTFTRAMIDKIWYMNELPHKVGHEHSFFTIRAIHNWFAPWYIDVLEPKVNNMQIIWDIPYVLSVEDAYNKDNLKENAEIFKTDKNIFIPFHD